MSTDETKVVLDEQNSEEIGCESDEHHHHHDEECEHEHHHHHHDGEECDCGEEHHHHHHHHDDEECDCGEEHHHHHHHGDDEECDCDEISIIHHDEALAASFKTKVQLDKNTVDKLINSFMNILCSIIDAHEGVIGHIKSAALSGENAVMYSLTYDEVSRVGDFDTLGTVDSISYAAIVYGIDEDTLWDYMVSIKRIIEAV